jgi:tetratricopeptide (TPR) repeat protein/TolB-like protein
MHRPRALLVCCLVALAGPAVAGPRSPGQPAAPGAGRILVMPFDNVAREPRIHWLGEAAAVLLVDDLNALGVSAISRSERVRTFERLHLPLVATLSRATVIRVGQLAGAAEIILGSLTLEDEELIVQARTIQLDSGQLLPDVVERGPLADLFGIVERLARRLRGLAPSEEVLPRPHPPLEAFEYFVKGLLGREASTQLQFLENALRVHPTYDRARLALWEVRTEAGEHEAALALASQVPDGSLWERRARFLEALSLIDLQRYDEAFDRLMALAGDRPTPAVYNNLGVVQLRRQWTPATGRPTYYFTRATEADADDPDYHFNLGYAYALEKDSPAALVWLREAVRRNPADGDAHFLLSLVLQATGSNVEAARERELAARLGGGHAALPRRTGQGEPAPRGLERLKTDLEAIRAQRLDAMAVSSVQRDQRELATFHLDRGRRLFEQERDREAIAELRRSVYLSPYQAEAHLLLGHLYLRTGRLPDAIDAFKIALWSEASVEAHLALAEAYLQGEDPEAARLEAERALALEPGSARARELLAGTRRPEVR